MLTRFLVIVLLCAPSFSQQGPALLEQLRAEVRQHKAGAEERFWAAVERANAPVIEEENGAPRKYSVTFIWHGRPETRNVVVISPLALIDIQEAAMARVEGTNVWTKTYDLPADTRFTYRFSENDSLVPFEKETNIFDRMKRFKSDALNPKSIDVGLGIQSSLLELPEAPSSKWSRVDPQVRKGRITESQLQSKALGTERTIWTYVPAGASREPMPLLVVMDGESYTTLVPTPTILDNLIAQRRIPRTAAVFVASDPATRGDDLNCNSKWTEFLRAEVLAEVHRQGIVFDPTRVVLAGSSLGGLAAACAVVERPDVFPMLLSQSGSYFRTPELEPEWLARKLVSSKVLPQRVYVEVGTLETAAIPSRDPSMLTANRHLRDVLQARGVKLKYVEHTHGHEHVAWQASLAEGLIYLLGNDRAATLGTSH